jgi:hypothetical protein
MRQPIETSGDHGPLARPLTRRGFNKILAGGGGLALVAGGAGSAFGGMIDAFAAGDTDIVNFALTAEYLAVDAYSRAITAAKKGQLGQVPTEVSSTLSTFLDHEQQHVTALQKAGGSARKPSFTYPADTFTSLTSAAKLALSLETAFVGAYANAVSPLQSPDLQTAAGTIGANEGEHRVILRYLLDMPPFVDLAFEKPVSVADATAAVDKFIVR